mmetsp:Transcript_821/g.2728  ORF Transcript_821/g.2728 Transcript_821/m.2728 type:complete len:953 (-) Transcript_821:2162-5020(-)
MAGSCFFVETQWVLYFIHLSVSIAVGRTNALTLDGGSLQAASGSMRVNDDILTSGNAAHVEGAWRSVVHAAAEGTLQCRPRELDSARHCICPTTSLEGRQDAQVDQSRNASAPSHCVGSICVTGRHLVSGTPIVGYRKGCRDCACIAADMNGTIESTWHFCAVAGQRCRCEGVVRFGSDAGGWAVNVVDGEVNCSTTYIRGAGDAPAECHCKPKFPSGQLDEPPVGWPSARPLPRLLIMTVATHREPFIDMVEQSVNQLGAQFLLHVVGIGEVFTGYGWKLQRVRRYLVRHRHRYDLALFIDSFDTYTFASPVEIVEKFLAFEVPMVVSGEVNIWPEPHLKDFMPVSSQDGHYKYPNSGTYMGWVSYIIEFYSGPIAIQAKSICVDDQGELIKALARNGSAFAIDHQAALFQTLFGSAKDDIQVRDGRPFNVVTGTRPCVLHANGWDKAPLLRIVTESGRFTPDEAASAETNMRLLEKKRTLQSRERAINARCEMHNPNPTLDPEDGLLKRYGVAGKSQLLRTRLQEAGKTWDVVEQEVWEVQEYLGFCPALEAYDGRSASENSSSIMSPTNFHADGFKVFLYPGPEGKLPAVYQAVRNAIRSLPYVTLDPSEAAVFVPDIDVSCWCESCLGNRRFDSMAVESKAVTHRLEGLDHWNGGRNHILFEFSDAPCIPFEPGHAIVASVGLSTFHYRQGLDVAMPLFAMVEFNASTRMIPAEKRRVLLSFRGTRSPRSDQTRRHLWKIHNGVDIITPCACRWFDADNNDSTGYDERCKLDEEAFQAVTYTELLSSSKFSLIVEGFGYHSFRLTEVLAAGAIPVIVIDHYVLPYEEILDWSTFSVRVPEHLLLQVPDILRAIPPKVVAAMQRRAAEAYEQYFWSLGAQVATALEQIRILHFTSLERRPSEIARLLADGLPYKEVITATPDKVQADSMYCNAPQHRRAQARDGAVMRR